MKVLKIYLIWLISLLIILYLGNLEIPKSAYASKNFFGNFANWDGRYYLTIAEFGYTKDLYYAFFPGYPIVIKSLTFITHNFLTSAIFINVVSSFFSIFIFYKLISLDFNKQIAIKGVYALLLFPASFYLFMVYSEALFLLLTLLTFYFFKKENFLLSTIFAFVAAVTRPVGLVLIFSLFFQIILNRGFNKKNWIFILSPIGFLFYCLFLYIQIGDPIYFLKVQSGWNRVIGFPWIGFWQAIYNIFQPGFITQYYYVLFDLLFTSFGLGMTFRSLRFLPRIYCFYAIGSIMIPLFTSNLSSMSRFLLPIFPIFILVALFKNRFVQIVYYSVSLTLLLIMATLFFNGYWVS